MLFLTWNLRHGGGARAMPRIVLTLLEHSPDVMVLTEFRVHTGGQIAGVLADHGWRHQASTSPPQGVNGLLVASRTPLRTVQPSGNSPTAPGLKDHEVVRSRRSIEVEFTGLDMALAGVHIPCDGKGLGREAVFQHIVGAARRRRDQSFILLGDFNAGRHGADESGSTFTCTRCLGELAAMGYTDAWRTSNGGKREYSWYGHDGAGFRIDHAFVSGPLKGAVRRCEYSHRERSSGLSDHSAMLLELDAPAAAAGPRAQKFA
jgi:exodeoxyribonuclease-3